MKTTSTHPQAEGWLAAAVVLFLLAASTAIAQLPNPTYGWNLGNTMEAPGGEGTWAPAATQDLINQVAASGFNTIRIPIAWNSHANQTTYQIDPVWMARVKEVLGRGLPSPRAHRPKFDLRRGSVHPGAIRQDGGEVHQPGRPGAPG